MTYYTTRSYKKNQSLQMKQVSEILKYCEISRKKETLIGPSKLKSVRYK